MFYSILFPDENSDHQPLNEEMPECFHDLNLDQIIEPVLKSRSAEHLKSLFFTPLRDVDTIIYRQDIMRQFESGELFDIFNQFSGVIYNAGQAMKTIREHLTGKDKSDNNYLTRGRCLDYADQYCRAVIKLTEHLDQHEINSKGLKSFVEYIKDYSSSVKFKDLYAYICKLRDELSAVEYCMLIDNGNIRIRKYEGQEDHCKQIFEIFDKFRQDKVKDYRQKISEEPHALYVEAAVLDIAANLYKDIFRNLDSFCENNLYFTDEKLIRFAEEVQFYLGWQDYVNPLRSKGLSFCYPGLSASKEHLYSLNGFDLALAFSMFPKEIPVTNDFELNEPEHIFIITGPNQGGKTTFVRAFGQIHYLTSIGCCVPGSAAMLFLCDKIYTHFGSEEDISTLNGKLQDDLIRLRAITDQATPDSIIIINEIFASTTLNDALLLGEKMLNKITQLGCPAVCVTFLDELASHGAETVSMMSTVREDDPTQRTYKIERQPANGLAYALHIVRKHGLTYNELCGRLKT
ncbi:MAG: MutS-related protein [Eubacteriales bacterium]